MNNLSGAHSYGRRLASGAVDQHNHSKAIICGWVGQVGVWPFFIIY